MSPDKKGFIYPVIDRDTCIDCGQCVKVCDFRKFKPTELTPDCYAVKHTDEKEIATSRSGAFFIALAQYVLNKNGVVFGCVIENSRYVFIKYATDKEGVDAFKGSKYVQSDTRDTFKECADFLKEGKTILFSGLGCQVHGLISYLELKKVDTTNLITCDIVCHGAPSPKIWEQYIEYRDGLSDYKVVDVNFRNKELFGWRAHRESFLLSNATTTTTTDWTNAFYAHVMFRESCYNCKYTTPNRKSDFTIADYWGIEKNAPQFDDNKGVSLVLVRTHKAKAIFASLGNIRVVKTDLQNSLQQQLKKPPFRGKKYKHFWKDYLRNNKKAIKKYFFPSELRKHILKIEQRKDYLVVKFRSFCGKILRKLKIKK